MSYEKWPHGDRWTLRPLECLKDPKLAMDDEIAKSVGSINKGDLIMTEMPMIFGSLTEDEKDIPKVLAKAPFLLKFVYRILAKKRGGLRMANYFSRFQRSQLLGISEPHMDYIRFIMNRFRGLRMNTLLLLIRMVNETSYFATSPVLGLPTAMGLYENLPVLHHSCEPNARYYFRLSDGKVFVRAIRDIKTGERVTISRHENIGMILDTSLRHELLRKKFNIEGCKCVRCSSAPPPTYDSDLKKLMAQDEKRSKLPRKKIELMMEELDSFVPKEEGIYVIDDFWKKFGVEIHCPLTNLRLARTYAAAFLCMTYERHEEFEKIRSLGGDGDGCIAGREEEGEELLPPEMMSLSQVGTVYKRSIEQLEKMQFLGLKSLTRERIRLYLFQALLCMPAANDQSFSVATLTPKTIRFIQLYSTAMELAQQHWGSSDYLLVEASFGFETLAAILGVGKHMEQTLGAWVADLCKQEEQ